MEPRLRHLLLELSELLREAIADSAPAIEKVDQIQEEGYSVHLLLDCKPADEDDAIDVVTEATLELERAPAVPTERPIDPAKATFRINADDLRFLRSVGIDPTRRARRRRPSRESPQQD